MFVFDDDVLVHASDARVRFLLDSLAELRATYRDRGSDLVLARGDPVELLTALAAAVDADAIHDWSELSAERRDELAPDYPVPIVNHGERREQALAMFERARGEEPEAE